MMARRLLGALLASCIPFLAVTPGRAEIGVIDNVPGATVLLPYFEVDLANPNGMTTLFSLTNGFLRPGSDSGATAILVNVTLWTDLGIPTMSFNIYFTGYDTIAVNIRDIFNGNLPVTATDGQDPTDTISSQGIISQDINFASCTGFPYAPLPAALVTALRNAHTGLSSALTGNQCAGFNHGDNIARGYITMDTVNSCTASFSGYFPGSPGYFVSGGGGTATNQNHLWGDYFLISPANNFAQGETLVALEASASLGRSGTYTFYGRLVGGSGADNREPLATQWAAPYAVGGSSNTTDLLVWRDPGRPLSPFACGSLPAPFPLGQQEIMAFDTEENHVAPTPPAGSLPFPLAAMRTAIPLGAGGPLALGVADRAGWLRLNLNTTMAGSVLPPGASQSHVTVIKQSEGRFSGAHAATALDSALGVVQPNRP